MSAGAVAAAVQIAAQAYSAIKAAVEGQDMDPEDFTRQVQARIAESEQEQARQLAKDRALWESKVVAAPSHAALVSAGDSELVRARALEQAGAALARLQESIQPVGIVLPAWVDDDALDD